MMTRGTYARGDSVVIGSKRCRSEESECAEEGRKGQTDDGVLKVRLTKKALMRLCRSYCCSCRK